MREGKRDTSKEPTLDHGTPKSTARNLGSATAEAPSKNVT
jgi:hypothetical protein